MKALQFSVNTARFISAKAAGLLFGDKVFYSGPLRTVRLAEVPEPELPSKDWAKIRTIYCGFCGSDLNLILLHDSPTASPFTSFPCVIGHEIVGEVMEVGSGCDGLSKGDIVVINPALGCEIRNVTPPCSICGAGRSGSCENMAEGDLGPGMFTGINNALVGGFAPYLVAHKSQIFRSPKSLSPEAAVMTEPLAVALQAIMDNKPKPGANCLVIGAGVIGNLVIQSLKTLEQDCTISVIEPSSFAGELAYEMGADEVIQVNDIFKESSRITGAKAYKPLLGMDICMGGFDRIYDTVGNSKTLNLSMRTLKALGVISVIGIGGNVNLDLTPLWLKLQTIKGVYSYGRVNYNDRDLHAFDLALEFMKDGRIQAEKMVTHKFKLEDYKKMIELNKKKAKHRAVKTVVSFVD